MVRKLLWNSTGIDFFRTFTIYPFLSSFLCYLPYLYIPPTFLHSFPSNFLCPHCFLRYRKYQPCFIPRHFTNCISCITEWMSKCTVCMVLASPRRSVNQCPQGAKTSSYRLNLYITHLYWMCFGISQSQIKRYIELSF